jgi:hypothetical protein
MHLQFFNLFNHLHTVPHIVLCIYVLSIRIGHCINSLFWGGSHYVNHKTESCESPCALQGLLKLIVPIYYWLKVLVHEVHDDFRGFP